MECFRFPGRSQFQASVKPQLVCLAKDKQTQASKIYRNQIPPPVAPCALTVRWPSCVDPERSGRSPESDAYPPFAGDAEALEVISASLRQSRRDNKAHEPEKL